MHMHDIRYSQTCRRTDEKTGKEADRDIDTQKFDHLILKLYVMHYQYRLRSTAISKKF